jgi:hypothetical protein
MQYLFCFLGTVNIDLVALIKIHPFSFVTLSHYHYPSMPSNDASFLIVEDSSPPAVTDNASLKLTVVEPLVDASNYDRWKHLVMLELYPYNEHKETVQP